MKHVFKNSKSFRKCLVKSVKYSCRLKVQVNVWRTRLSCLRMERIEIYCISVFSEQCQRTEEQERIEPNSQDIGYTFPEILISPVLFYPTHPSQLILPIHPTYPSQLILPIHPSSSYPSILLIHSSSSYPSILFIHPSSSPIHPTPPLQSSIIIHDPLSFTILNCTISYFMTKRIRMY